MSFPFPCLLRRDSCDPCAALFPLCRNANHEKSTRSVLPARLARLSADLRSRYLVRNMRFLRRANQTSNAKARSNARARQNRF